MSIQIDYKGHKVQVREEKGGGLRAMGFSIDGIYYGAVGSSLEELKENLRANIEDNPATVVMNGPETLYSRHLGGACQVFLTLEDFQGENPGTEHETWKISQDRQYYWQPGTMYGNSAGDVCVTETEKTLLISRGGKYYLQYR